jgi:hypothetical protein
MITSINEILTEWAFRTKDGLPNPKSMAHQILLEGILKNYGWSVEARAELLNNLVEKTLVKNKESGAVYLVKNVNDEKHDVIKKDASEKDLDKAKGDKEPDGEEGIEVPEETRTTTKYKDETYNFLSNSDVPEHKEVKELMNKLWNGNSLSDGEKKFLSNWIRVVEPTEGSKNPKYKFYVAREEGNFSRKAAPRAEKIPKSPSTGKDAKQFHGWMQQNGIATQRTSTFGGKKTTANQTFTNEDGSTRLLGSEDNPAATVQRDTPDSPPTSITIGNQVIKRQDDKELGISKKEAKRRRRHNRNLNEYAKAIEGGTLDFIDMDEGVTPDSPENRVTVIKGAISGMVKQMRKLAGEPIAGQPAPLLDNKAQQILDDLEEFAKRDPNEDAGQWKKDFDALMSRLSNHEVLTEGWANYAEVYTAVRDMHDNGRGTENGACVLLPESTTLETVDTIVISTSGEGERKIVTLDGVSVKKGVGGASALTSKVEKSIFKSVGDLSREEIKEEVVKMSKAHDAIYGMDLDEEDLQSHLDYQNSYRMNMEDRARKVGVSEEYIEQIRKDAESSTGKVENALKLIMKERKVAGLPVDEDTEEKLRQRLRSYYTYQMLSHQAYNQNVDVQDFSNESVSSQTKTQERERRIDIDSSDGVSILAYPKPEFNVGFSLDGRSRNPGSGRFHNEEKRV